MDGDMRLGTRRIPQREPTESKYLSYRDANGKTKYVPYFKNNFALMKPKMTVYQMGGKMPIVPDPKKKLSAADQKFNAAARSREAENLTEMRNALKAEGPEELAKFDKELKAKGFKVVKKRQEDGRRRQDAYVRNGW
jgi:hypothetical protein